MSSPLVQYGVAFHSKFSYERLLCVEAEQKLIDRSYFWEDLNLKTFSR